MSEKIQETQYVTKNTNEERVYAEAAGEYTLPDYQPEIRKILHIRPSVLPGGKYIGGQKAEFAGTVAHAVLYADGEGKAASVTLDSEYTYALPLPEEGDYTAIGDAVAESTVCRLGGPRKLSLRTRVRGAVCLSKEENIAPEIRGMGSEEDKASLETWGETKEAMQLCETSSGEFTLTATLRMDNPGTDSRVVWAGGNLLIQECKAAPGGVNCRGEAWVRVILQEGGLSPYTVREKIPFDQFVAVENMAEGACCIAHGRLPLLDVTVIPGEGEENGMLGLDISCEIDVCTVAARPVYLTKDLYSTNYDMVCRYRSLDVMRPLGTFMGHYTVGGSRPRGECDAENATAVVDADGRVEVEAVTVEHGRATVSGKLVTTVIFSAAGQEGDCVLSSCEVTCPLRIETDLRPAPGTDPQFSVHADLGSARARIEPNAIAVDAEVALCGRAYQNSETTVLQSAEPGASVERAEGARRLFAVYPKEGDTLFSLCARYHKSRATVAAQNQLAEDAVAISHLTHSLDGVHHLLLSDDV